MGVCLGRGVCLGGGGPEGVCLPKGGGGQTPPTPCGQTHACENITFPQLRLRAATISDSNCVCKEESF